MSYRAEKLVIDARTDVKLQNLSWYKTGFVSIQVLHLLSKLQNGICPKNIRSFLLCFVGCGFASYFIVVSCILLACTLGLLHFFSSNRILIHCVSVVTLNCVGTIDCCHDDVIKWKHFLRYWLFVQGIHRLTVNSPDKGQWRGALMFSLICVRRNGWANNGDAGDLRRNFAHYDVIVMEWSQRNATKFESSA